jgi:hypothetical protein
MNKHQIHSIALFWCAVGVASGAAATHYIPVIYVVGIGLLIVALIIAHQASGFMKRQRKAASTFNRQNNGKRRKKSLPRTKGA